MLRVELTPGELRFTRRLGSGSYGVVSEAVHRRTGEEFAVKSTESGAKDLGIPSSVLREVGSLLALPPSPHVVRLVAVFHCGTSVQLVFDLAKGGDLETALDELLIHGRRRGAEELWDAVWSDEGSRRLSRQMLLAVRHLHSHRIAHRDIKPANLLFRDVSRRHLVLCDFGLTRDETPPRRVRSHAAFTAGYRPPEVILDGQYTARCDLWSAGCTIAELLRRESGPLFNGMAEVEVLIQIAECLGRPDRDLWPSCGTLPGYQEEFPRLHPKGFGLDGCSEEGREVVELLVRYDPRSRVSAADALKLPYFSPPSCPSLD
eukprot:Hpha_TRINITY_DN16363_c5_g1::TRINITY_DN16363_c5_g1_i1::g.60011::m.60011/K02088/CDK3; cyclin-dependent kinase 3